MEKNDEISIIRLNGGFFNSVAVDLWTLSEVGLKIRLNEKISGISMVFCSGACGAF